MTEWIDYPHGRNDLAVYLADHGFNTGAEIGVEQGNFSKTMLDANPKLKLYLIDSWKSRNGALILRDGEIIESNQSIIDQFFRNTINKLKQYDVDIMRCTSKNAVKKFKDKSLDFVYIDADHSFDAVMFDIIKWSAKVRNGGIVSGHDYIIPGRTAKVCLSLRERKRSEFEPDNSVKFAVDAYASAHNVRQVYILKGDNCPTWLFFKQ